MTFDERPKREILVTELVENAPTQTRRAKLISSVLRGVQALLSLIPRAKTGRGAQIQEEIEGAVTDIAAFVASAMHARLEQPSLDGLRKRAEIINQFEEAALKQEQAQLLRE